MTDDVKQEPMSLADRDKYLVQIEEQIQAKRNLLLGKRKFLESTLKQNTFLDGVKNDYDKYYGYIATTYFRRNDTNQICIGYNNS